MNPDELIVELWFEEDNNSFEKIGSIWHVAKVEIVEHGQGSK